MSFDPASNKDKSRWDADKHSLKSSFANSGDDAALTGLFQQAFGNAHQPSPDIHLEEEFPLDDFEAGVLTSCMLSSVESVPTPAGFEDEVMARIRADKPVGETPRSFRSPLLRHTSRELYRRYRRVVQVVFPLAAAASIVVALYVKDNGSGIKSWISTWLPVPVNMIEEQAPSEKPEFPMQVPAPESVTARPADAPAQAAGGNKTAPAKKKVKREKIKVITGE